jgi:adenylate cyclase
MTIQGVKRKLTAILSADVEGYSRLMSQDEVGTVRTLNAYREAISNLVQQYRGRVVDAPGDNLLAEFSSIVDAVNCAVEIQRELAERNAELPETRKMQFRIGVNLGDVLEEEGRIYGDGVNIAARVESLAEAGGICISGTVYEHIENKLGLEYEYLGEQEVKNIEKPVRVYQVLSIPEAAAHRVIIAKKEMGRRWAIAGLVTVAFLVVGVAAIFIWNHFLRPAPPSVELASVERMAFPLPDKPSIAVLPFANLSKDPEQEYLADGITENIITALSYIPEMFVIARNSTFTYKGKPVKVQQVSEELGVRYVLEGSVQRAGDRVRVTAQLVDATTGHHLWAKRYDRDIEELFALQDDITQEIVVELQVELLHGEGARQPGSTHILEAWEYGVKATSLFQRFTKEDNTKARELFEQAIEIDPEYAFAWTMLAWTHWIDANFGFSESPAESFKRAVELARKAVALDDTQPNVHALLGAIHLFQRQYEKAIAEGERSIALGPNDATSHVLLANTMYYAGRFEEAITLAKKAMRLAPYHQAWYLGILAQSYRMAGRYEEAVAAYKQLLDRSRKGEFSALWPHSGLVEVYVELGREEEARAHAAEVMRIDPKFSLETWSKAQFFKDPAHLERRLDAKRKAGLK